MFTDADMPEETDIRDELREDGMDMPDDSETWEELLDEGSDMPEDMDIVDEAAAISQRIHGRSSVSTHVILLFEQNASPPFAHAPAHAFAAEADEEILEDETCDEERDEEMREDEADDGSIQLMHGNPGVT